MEIYDQHMHSKFSFDGKDTINDECESAISKGLSGICLTEHFSVDELDVSYGFLKYDDYHKAIDNCRAQFGKKLRIGRGLEIGEPHLEKCKTALNDVLSTMDLDLIIGSIHNIDSIKMRLFRKDKTKDEFYGAYFKEVLKMTETTDIDIIGHLDLVKRYAMLPPEMGDYDFNQYKDIITDILNCAVKRGIGIEINTAGWRKEAKQQYPKFEIIQLYKELGGKYITLGSDSHNVKDIAADFERAADLFKKAGFKNYYYYVKRKPYPVSF